MFPPKPDISIYRVASLLTNSVKQNTWLVDAALLISTIVMFVCTNTKMFTFFCSSKYSIAALIDLNNLPLGVWIFNFPFPTEGV